MQYDKSLLEVMQWKEELSEFLSHLTIPECLEFLQNHSAEMDHFNLTANRPSPPGQAEVSQRT
ncbi:MAG: hypothetical protein BWK78_06445 [Thiotrichaceae bacterium IS1]|nr:MAG: hypothetical protein BWK78_06445 [Thiotrichaceae bacterium IS1]